MKQCRGMLIGQPGGPAVRWTGAAVSRSLAASWRRVWWLRLSMTRIPARSILVAGLAAWFAAGFERPAAADEPPAEETTAAPDAHYGPGGARFGDHRDACAAAHAGAADPTARRRHGPAARRRRSRRADRARGGSTLWRRRAGRVERELERERRPPRLRFVRRVEHERERRAGVRLLRDAKLFPGRERVLSLQPERRGERRQRRDPSTVGATGRIGPNIWLGERVSFWPKLAVGVGTAGSTTRHRPTGSR